MPALASGEPAGMVQGFIEGDAAYQGIDDAGIEGVAGTEGIDQLRRRVGGAVK